MTDLILETLTLTDRTPAMLSADQAALLSSDIYETVTFYSAVAAGGYGSGILVTRAHRQPAEQEVPQQGVVVSEETVCWRLWMVSAASPIQPKPGDRLVDGAGRRWLVLEVKRMAFGNVLDCTARREL